MLCEIRHASATDLETANYLLLLINLANAARRYQPYLSDMMSLIYL